MNDAQKLAEAEKEEIDINTQEFRDTLSDPQELMKALNEANWGYHMQSHDGVYKFMINDLDCMRISYRQNKLGNGRKINQMGDTTEHNESIFLPLSGLTANLNTEDAYYDARKKRFYDLIRSEDGIRKRSWLSRKYIYQSLTFVSAADNSLEDVLNK